MIKLIKYYLLNKNIIPLKFRRYYKVYFRHKKSLSAVRNRQVDNIITSILLSQYLM